MSVEDIKLMAAYMVVHGKHEDEQIAIGHTLINKVVGSMGGMGDMPGLEEDKKKEFFDLINNAQTVGKEDEDAYKRNLIIAGAIQSGRLKDTTNGATEFSKEKVKGATQIKDTHFFKPQEAEVMALPTNSPKGRKTKKV
jgi:hypothetical protein